MRISKRVRLAGGVLVAGSLLLVGVAGQASAYPYGIIGGAAGGSGGGGGGGGGTPDPCAQLTYQVDGYTCGTTSSPAPGAILVHVKLRGHLHELDFKFNGASDLDLQRENSENVWFDPAKITSGTVTLAGNSTVNFDKTQNECFFEDKHGNLAWATSGGDCTPY